MIVPMSDRFGRTTAGVVQQVQSGTPYGAAGSVRTGAIVGNLGYETPPDSVTYFFTDRDAFRTDSMYRTDLSLNYLRRLPGLTKGEFFAQVQVLNLFDRFQLYNLTGNGINTTVLSAVTTPSRFQAFDPFTERPVQGVHWDYGSTFRRSDGRWCAHATAHVPVRSRREVLRRGGQAPGSDPGSGTGSDPGPDTGSGLPQVRTISAT